MKRNGTDTRERILDVAQELILNRGYAGMTLDHLLAKVGATKGAFFHHFKTKDDLARALIRRFAESDTKVYSDTRARAERLSSDPLQQMLVFIGLFEESFAALTEPYPGCLFASYTHELQLFDDETRTVIEDSFKMWRRLLKEKFDAIARVYPPRIPVDTATLADAFTVVLEGAFVTSKAVNSPTVVAEQLRHFRNYVQLLFGPSI